MPIPENHERVTVRADDLRYLLGKARVANVVLPPGRYERLERAACHEGVLDLSRPEPAFYHDSLLPLDTYINDAATYAKPGDTSIKVRLTRDDWVQAGRPADLRVTVQTP